jgi:nucleoside-diphosphate-sugar epimerase
VGQRPGAVEGLGMNVLLTGATGFIGSHLARLLVSNGAQVTAIVKPSSSRWRISDLTDSLQVIECDVADRAFLAPDLRRNVPDVCIHLAWHGWSGPSLTAEENLSSLAASLELLRALADAGCRRFVGVGTCFEYDTTPGMLHETTPAGPKDLYGACKHSLFIAAQALSPIANMEVAWARVFLVYGPRDDERRLVPSLALSLIRGEVAKTTPGEQVRDVVHVADAASAIWALARSTYTGPVNVASGVPVKVVDIARQIATIVGRPELLHVGALPYRSAEPAVLVADTTVLRERIGWTPKYGLVAGLTDAVEWWRAQEVGRRGVVG